MGLLYFLLYVYIIRMRKESFPWGVFSEPKFESHEIFIEVQNNSWKHHEDWTKDSIKLFYLSCPCVIRKFLSSYSCREVDFSLLLNLTVSDLQFFY